MKKILLVGNPNVGKSAIFSRLTGAKVIASNYAGTTVEYTHGYMYKEGEKMEVIDVPGMYSLEPTSKAEAVAVDMLEEFSKEDDILLVNIVDSTNLERNLHLTLQLIKKKIPMLILLNFWDETSHKGINIDCTKTEEIFGIPVIPTCALSGRGINDFVNRIPDGKVSSLDFEEDEKWDVIGKIVEKVQKLQHHHHTFKQMMSELTIRPLSGLIFAVIVLFISFVVIRFIGESLIGYVFEPIFTKLWQPLILDLSGLLGGSGFLHDILIGQLIEGEIVFEESLGLLTTGLFVPLAMVLPYIAAFYLVLNILEDTGYLPRLGVLVDTFLHKLGIHGLSIIPLLLGLGCNVPGALSTRILETRREKFIVSTLMAIAVPCMAQIAMIVGLLGNYGTKALAAVFGTLFVVLVIVGFIMNKLVSGESPEIFTEIPPYRFPYFKGVFKKLWIRVHWFIKEAIPFVLIGVLFINILYTLGIIQFIGRITAPVITGILGLPQSAVGALIVGFLRKDVAVGMLAPLGLSVKQIIIASVVLAMYFPCIATFAVLVKELGVKDMIKSAVIMIVSTLIVGGILNLIL
ncbi:MAG: ferrous iron transporter B [Candidatus Cloacimonetes bacterium]|nr:ferrous iron transporter B [Candidatus Cloacimonadota bacterium]